jgi:hypothetical protein
MQGYINDRKMVFTTKLRVVLKRDGYELDPKILAEPGDLLLVEGGLLHNLSRAAYQDPHIISNIDEAMFVRAQVS